LFREGDWNGVFKSNSPSCVDCASGLKAVKNKLLILRTRLTACCEKREEEDFVGLKVQLELERDVLFRLRPWCVTPTEPKKARQKLTGCREEATFRADRNVAIRHRVSLGR